MNRLAIAVALAMLAAGCGAASAVRRLPPEPVPAPQHTTARLLFVGDVMLGRDVAAHIGDDADDLFRPVRSAIRSADLAAFNLESPLTTLPHLSNNPNDLRADPALAVVLAAAGFDVASLANNHTGDAGAGGIAEMTAALQTAGISTVGSRDSEASSLVVDVAGVRVGMAAFTEVASDAFPGSASVWDPAVAESEVRNLAAMADVVAVAFHGGSEGIPAADPGVVAIAGQLAEWGADIVWGHGPHVPHRLDVIRTGDDRDAIIATSLGNFLFDQNYAPNQTGHVLEVFTTRTGLVAYRLGVSRHTTAGVESIEWEPPTGDAAFLEGAWWSMVGDAVPEPVQKADIPSFEHGDVIAASWGDITGDGRDDLIAAYRHALRETPLNRLHPDRVWQDSDGRSAHIGVFEPDGTPIWGAGTLAFPINEFAPCDGAIAVAYSTFAGDSAGTGVLLWRGFGLFDGPVLPDPGRPACGDVDGDGTTEPLILRRTSILRP